MKERNEEEKVRRGREENGKEKKKDSVREGDKLEKDREITSI